MAYANAMLLAVQKKRRGPKWELFPFWYRNVVFALAKVRSIEGQASIGEELAGQGGTSVSSKTISSCEITYLPPVPPPGDGHCFETCATASALGPCPGFNVHSGLYHAENAGKALIWMDVV